MNYFTLLGLEPTYSIDISAPEAAYIKAQQTHHPDRMVGKLEQARAAAIQHSMDVNEGYETLKNPLKRAQHLLALQGITVNSEDDSIKPSPELLMEVMEMREQLDGVQTERDAALVFKDMKEAMKQGSASLAEAFDSKDYPRAAQLTMRMRYLGKSLEEAFARQYQLKAAG